MPDFCRSTLRVSWIVAVMFWVAGATEAGQGAGTAGEPQNVRQETPTSVGMIAAVRDGDHDAVRSLLAEGWDVNAAQGDGATALHWAAHRNDLHRRSLTRLEETAQALFLSSAREPVLSILTPKDDRHPVVNWLDQFVGDRSQNGESFKDLSRSASAPVPETGESKRSPSL